MEVSGKAVPTEIYAVIARPLKSGSYPGLLVLHGGGGSAEVERIRKWAAKGYIAVSIDIPGVAAPDKVPNTSGFWKTYPYGEHRFTAEPDITHSTIFDGAVAALQAFYLLRSQPDVVKDKIGITGISWGGYMTTILSGLASPYVHASFSTYGSGYYDAGSTFLKLLDKMPETERATWLKYLDAGRRAKKIASPFFIAAATNDNWFYPPAVMATLNAVHGPAAHFFAPNNSHTAAVPGGNGSAGHVGFMQMEETYFNFYLKGIGLPLPVISIEDRIKKDNDNYILKFSVQSKTAVTSATVYYSTADTLWTKRKWIMIKAIPLTNGNYEAHIPASVTAKDTWCFASISDDRPVTVSSKMIPLQ